MKSIYGKVSREGEQNSDRESVSSGLGRCSLLQAGFESLHLKLVDDHNILGAV